MAQLLTTADAARIIGAGTTSVKRWADSGLLDCVRTTGGHRRFTRDSLDRFVRLRCHEEPEADDVDRWVDTLLSEMSLELALVRARARFGSWARVAEDLDPVLVELGLRWAQGRVTVAQEHVAAERLSRALARISESLPLLADAPMCLLACVESEEHTLGLSLAELCLRELGWVSVWLGARTPAGAISERLHLDRRICLVGLSASEACLDPLWLGRIRASVGAECLKRGVGLMLGGRGPWPDLPAYGLRVRSFSAFGDVLKRFRPPTGNAAPDDAVRADRSAGGL